MRIIIKALSLLLIFSSVYLKRANGQTIAGVIPTGMTTINPHVSLSAATCFSSDSAAFSIDCKSSADIAVKIYKSATAVDGENTATLYVLNDTVSICYDTGSFGGPHYYNYGDTLNCIGSRKLVTDSIYQLGDAGCMLCFGPASETNMYLEYIKGTQIGWIEISFNLNDGGSCSLPITLSITSVVSNCVSGIEELSANTEIHIYPNPNDGKFTIENKRNEELRMDIYNILGEKVYSQQLNSATTQIDLGSQAKGLYLYRIVTLQGNLVSQSRFIIQ